jgi:glycosyltransferase involved in cell wall biosynthesis
VSRRRPRATRSAAAPRAPLRVLHVINDLACGGAQRMVLQQSAALDPAGFRCEVASLEIDRAPGLVSEFAAAGIPVHRLRQGREPLAWAALRLPGLVRRLRPDVVHTHLAAAGVAGRLAARLAGVPRVVTTQHNLSDWEEKHGHPLRALDRATLGRADAVIAVSDAIRSAVTRALPPLAPRVVTVRNGVPVESFAHARGERRQRRAEFGLSADAFVVGSVARLDGRKGLDTLIEAFAWVRLPGRDIRLLIVGDGPERGRLRQLAEWRGLDDRVTMISLPQGARAALAAMDLFVAPSRTEGLGVAIIEALAAGLPVLASRVGGIPEVVTDGECGRLLPPDEPQAWADAILRAAGGEDPLERWSAAATRRAESFSIARSARELERVYAPGDPAAEAEPDRAAA